MQDVMALGIAFYAATVNFLHKKTPPSLEAKLLLPIKCLAYGVPGHAFGDYFQMSPQLANDCRDEFDDVLRHLYQTDYMGVPTSSGLMEISLLHEGVHGIPGMFGCLDCMHIRWKNCPVAWQGSYKGSKKVPTLVLEAIADHNLYFHHASFGYAGSLNDINILNLSPFLERLTDGSFAAAERESGVIPYDIAGYQFEQFHILVDGIYPPYSRFVSTIANPIYWYEKRYAKWQEATRKDIERAFGVLQGMFQYTARPLKELDLLKIGKRVNSCLILHNMCVADRIMDGDVTVPYKANNGIIGFEVAVQSPPDLEEVQGSPTTGSDIGMAEVPHDVANRITRREAWAGITSIVEHNRLRGAIVQKKTGYKLNTRVVR